MADRDDVDSWLSERVEPLPPPPGTFELIKRRARRRKYRRLAFTATAAAVIVAAAVTVPQVVSLPVRGPAVSGQAAAGNAASSAQAAGGGAGAAAASSAARSSAASAPPGAGVPAPVPADFRPTSVTFTGTRTGWVIGQAGTPGHCATAYCTSVARTDDAGRTWAGVPAPVTGAPDGATGAGQIRFLDTADGWAFGPALYETHDGGRHWAAVNTHGLRVTALEAVGERAFGVFASCRGSGPAFAAGCTRFTLYSSPAAGGPWAPVGAVTTGLTGGGAASLVLTGSRGYLLAPDGTLYAGPVDGSGAWQRAGSAPSGCAVGPARADGRPAGALLAAVKAGDLILACVPGGSGASAATSRQQKLVYASADGGASWRAAARAPDAGVALGLAASPSGTVVLGTDEGIDVLPAGSGGSAGSTGSAGSGASAGSTGSAGSAGSAGSGASAVGTDWRAAELAGAGPAGGFGYVGMTTSAQGVALPADASSGTVWFTFDGGRSWRPSRIGPA